MIDASQWLIGRCKQTGGDHESECDLCWDRYARYYGLALVRRALAPSFRGDYLSTRADFCTFNPRLHVHLAIHLRGPL